MDRKEIENIAFELFSSYHPFLTIYRKAMRDICEALKKGEDRLKIYGMNNTKGSIAIIEAAMDNIEMLALFQSFEGCEVPEIYQKKYKERSKRQMKERRTNEKISSAKHV